MDDIVRTVEYWDENARWYRLWVEHNSYHDRIKKVLDGRVRPDWRILDIGGGGGILSIPLAVRSCDTTVLEPSGAMRRYLADEAARTGLTALPVDSRRWEDTAPGDFPAFDLYIACNTLHLLSIGFDEAVDRIIDAGPANILIVTERVDAVPARFCRRRGYDLVLYERYSSESSFVYHTDEEAREHVAFRQRCTGNPPRTPPSLHVSPDGHYRVRDMVPVQLFWFERRNSDTPMEGAFQCTPSR